MPYGQAGWGAGGPGGGYGRPPKRGGSGKALLAIVLSLVVAGLGAGVWVFLSPVGAGSSSFGLGSSDFYEDASGLKKILKKTPGKKAKYLTITIYPEYAIATVAPKSGTKAPSFMVRGGTSKQWTRMPMMTKPDQVDKAAFRLSDVDFEAIPAIASRAADDLEMPEGSITHMMLQRPLPLGRICSGASTSRATETARTPSTRSRANPLPAVAPRSSITSRMQATSPEC